MDRKPLVGVMLLCRFSSRGENAKTHKKMLNVMKSTIIPIHIVKIFLKRRDFIPPKDDAAHPGLPRGTLFTSLSIKVLKTERESWLFPYTRFKIYRHQNHGVNVSVF